MLVWPIVTRFDWTYRDIFEAAQKKFPGDRGYPFDDIGKHCREVLGLEINKKQDAHADAMERH